MVIMYDGDKKSTYVNSEIQIDDDTATLRSEVLRILQKTVGKKIIFLMTCNTITVYFLYFWAGVTKSVALRAYADAAIFNVFALGVCLISVWVEQGTKQSEKPYRTPEHRFYHGDSLSDKWQTRDLQCRHSFGRTILSEILIDNSYSSQVAALSHNQRCGNTSNNGGSTCGRERYEVLALLLSSSMILLAESLTLLEVFYRMQRQPAIHTEQLGMGALLGLAAYLGTILIHRDAKLDHVVCKALSCPTLKGWNPIVGGNLIGGIIVYSTCYIVYIWEAYTVDTAASFAVISMTAVSMFPLAFHTASIVLQMLRRNIDLTQLPQHMSEQLTLCLREALLIDGVLELRNEKFWMQSFGKITGSLEVRIRKNADENFVLNSVKNRVSMVVSSLTVKMFRDTRCDARKLDRPWEYYIDELLPDREEKTASAYYFDIALARIEEFLGIENSFAEIFTLTSEKLRLESSV